MNTPDFHVEPARCPNCAPCTWHALECPKCGCESSCLAPRVIVPANVVLGEN